jgi:VIT1/CCC1 family predicted Fe2+/Mn2+ transporter
VMEPAEIEALRTRVLGLPKPPARAGLDTADLRGAVAVFLWVVLSTFPVVIPFIVMRDPVPALRASNAIAVALLFAAGWAFGRLTGRNPAVVGAAMVVLGSLLVGITMALGG